MEVHHFYRFGEVAEKKVSSLFGRKPLNNRLYLTVKLSDRDITGLLDFRSTSTIAGANGVALIMSINLKINASFLKNISTADNRAK